MTKHRRAALVTAACALALLFLVAWGQPEDDAVALINLERTAVGIPPLRVNAALERAAEGHSWDMALNGFVGHTGSDGSTPWERIEREGYTDWYAAGEVVGCTATASSMVKAWMSSLPHRTILLNPDLLEIGVGYAYEPSSPWRHYWTANLGSRPTCMDEGACPFAVFLPLVLKRNR